MKILFAAGGTGGHINPALAAAGDIRERFPDAEILFVGTKDKMESKLVPQAGFDFATIDIDGFYRQLTLENLKRNFKTLFKVLRASGQAKKLIRRFQPDVVVGFGGYVSGPVLRMAATRIWSRIAPSPSTPESTACRAQGGQTDATGRRQASPSAARQAPTGGDAGLSPPANTVSTRRALRTG